MFNSNEWVAFLIDLQSQQKLELLSNFAFKIKTNLYSLYMFIVMVCMFKNHIDIKYNTWEEFLSNKSL